MLLHASFRRFHELMDLLLGGMAVTLLIGHLSGIRTPMLISVFSIVYLGMLAWLAHQHLSSNRSEKIAVLLVKHILNIGAAFVIADFIMWTLPEDASINHPNFWWLTWSIFVVYGLYLMRPRRAV